MKQGILHDYDLMANAEPTAKGNKCLVCDSEPVTYQWADYSGQAMCTVCGCAYQLKWGSDEQVKEGKYPYLSLKPEFISTAIRYWNETHKFCCYGVMLGDAPGYNDLIEWLKKNAPEWISSEQNPLKESI